MKKTKQELELLNKYLPSKYYGHEARNNAILLLRECLPKEVKPKNISNLKGFAYLECDCGSLTQTSYNYCGNCGSKLKLLNSAGHYSIELLQSRLSR